MARVRSLGLLATSVATRALAVTFQSVTTSAHAGAIHSAAASMPGSKVAAGSFKTDFIGSLLSTVVSTPSAPSPAPKSNAVGRSSADLMSRMSNFTPKEAAATARNRIDAIGEHEHSRHSGNGFL